MVPLFLLDKNVAIYKNVLLQKHIRIIKGPFFMFLFTYFWYNPEKVFSYIWKKSL